MGYFSLAESCFALAQRQSFFYSRAEAQRAQRLRRGIYIIRRKGAFGAKDSRIQRIRLLRL